METRAKVLIVDDQTLYREGLRGIIAHWPEFEVTGMVSSGEDAVRFCQRHAPDLVLMDVSMPGMGGVRAVSLIREALPDAIIVMLTVSADDEDVYGALHSGAGGYVLKDVPPEHLRTYMQAALRGQVSLSGVVATKFVKRAVVNPPKLAGVSVFADSKKELSEGERGILKLVGMGFSNEEIGAELYLSESTVKKYVAALKNKLGVDNRIQMAVEAYRMGLVE
ncbi:MAG: response regulator transcription factor [Eggerthellaceae bacterium]|nr:response regulator transcription factor [Eggerthellaceae bacterium]